MDDKPSASSWDDLIKEIGAAPAPDALERKRPAIETPLESAPKAAAARPPVKPKPGDWNALASDLGLEPLPEPPRAEPQRAAPRGRDAASANPPAAPTAREVEAGFAAIQPMESAFEEIIEEELDDVEFEDADDDSDLIDEDDDDDQDDDELDDEGDEQPPGLSGDAARSAFEALFQAGSFSGGGGFADAPRREPTARP